MPGLLGELPDDERARLEKIEVGELEEARYGKQGEEAAKRRNVENPHRPSNPLAAFSAARKAVKEGFDLALIVQEILSQESWYCNFEQNGFMLLYPQYDIEKFRTGDSSIVYTVTDKKTEEFFRFAIRGCAIPPGIG